MKVANEWVEQILTKGEIKHQNKKIGLFVVWYYNTAFVIHNNAVVYTSCFIATAKRNYDLIKKSL